ncbi:hypothetical protein FXV83_40550 [Bradyrhizobium hipponense]|uniref:Aspartate/glutamate racemase family protein n=1 Tax=Bradyrhizobium hipponense TaxID=2605638 RepID=A0A5S4YCM4_9BRAD|nr:AroM family protein [Bradyrhizobium hipponense]TYO61005.1 hypothetical protein FXV83_40550 [Bradyrhizobium hipponense]
MIDIPSPPRGKRWPRLPFNGAPLGVLMMERMGSDGRPFIPGDTGNASTWSVPARYKVIPGLNVSGIFAPDAGKMTEVVVQTARELAREGAQLITCHCGYSIQYQEAVRDAVDVPVFLSSLLLAPFLERMLPRDKALGIVVASKSVLTQEMLQTAGLRADIGRRVVIAGLEQAPAFAKAWIASDGDLDVEAVGKDVVNAAVALVNDRADIGMLLMECGDLPPYSAAVQRATGIPVFDYTSMVEFFVRGLVRKPFTGFI